MTEQQPPADNQSEINTQENPYWKAINWNNADKEDPTSLAVWNKLTSNFWLPEKISVSNDLTSWGKLTPQERDLTLKVFTGLTMLDTIQARFGATSLIKDARSLFEESVFTNIAFMESVHAKSYSNIFSTLSNTTDINNAFRWSEENEYLRKKADIIVSYYQANNDNDELAPLRRKVASTFLESFLFYSGFYWPLYLNSHQRLTNSADLIQLIIRDESVHGYFIGAKFQEELANYTQAQQDEVKEWAYDLLMELYDNEISYTQDLYDPVGLTEDVKVYLRYNANKALQNLGWEQLFPTEEVNPIITSQLSSNSVHDFFSGSGSSYSIATVENLSDDDWDEF